MVNLVPELELVNGSSAVPELAPQEAQNRFEAVLRASRRVRSKEPFGAFLDDLNGRPERSGCSNSSTDPKGQHLL